jgi:hypothetical protein
MPPVLGVTIFIASEPPGVWEVFTSIAHAFRRGRTCLDENLQGIYALWFHGVVKGRERPAAFVFISLPTTGSRGLLMGNALSMAAFFLTFWGIKVYYEKNLFLFTFPKKSSL